MFVQQKFTALDTLKTLHKNDKVDIESDVDEKLQEIYDQLLAERDNIIEYNEYRRIYKKFMKTKKQ
jgi:trans-2-enoyl-CoA reductase